ncbi:ABC transporter substrate-binding protein [Paenibacillus xylanexedens]|uniref:ABC transporter substrate-binding protein n=1 Tax=Paenibacillus xylanexedens TaxID=528191 RepID=UPI0011A7D67F|nr:ABC transporter substrate-binding protein [Paenibacillus xylanexedens]
MYRHGKKAFLSLTLVLSMLLAACVNSSEQQEDNTATPKADITIKDDFGHNVTYSAKSSRILAPYMEDALVTLGITPIAKYSAGGTVQQHLEPWLKELPIIDLTSGISPEAVVELDPDLVLISSHFLPVDKYDTIAKAAPTYLIDGGNTDWRAVLNKLATLLDKTDVAEAKMIDYDKEIATARDQLKNVSGDQTVAIVWPSEKEFYLVGSQFLSGKLIYGELGLIPHPLATTTSDNFVALSLEKVAELDADELFIITPEGQTEKQVRELLQGIPLWAELPAVKNKKVYHVESGHWINSAYLSNLSVVDDVKKALLDQ